MTIQRRDRLVEALQRAGMAAAAVVPGANLRYLAGLDMHMNERVSIAFVTAAGEVAMVLPKLEAPRAEAQATIPLQFYPWTDDEGPADVLHRCLDDLGVQDGQIAVEYTAMRVLELRAIEAAAPGLRAEDATPIFARLRMVKDADELALMRKAVRIVEEALREAVDQIRVGMTERELADIWNRAMAVRGAAPSFETIVASGPNAANPHHSNSDRAFQPGDLIVMDGGALHQGYASDITRTIAVGEPSPELRRVYEIVKLANEVGRRAARPGVSGANIDRSARDVIEDSGYGPQFLHRTGHGLGLEIHEPPYIVAGSDTPLPVGATFTIEPGVYVPNLGGVRIEDDVVITEQGAESLTTFDRSLIIV